MNGRGEDPAGRVRIRDRLDASGVLGIPDRLLPRGVRVAREEGGGVLFSEVASGERTARFTHLIVEREDLRQASGRSAGRLASRLGSLGGRRRGWRCGPKG